MREIILTIELLNHLIHTVEFLFKRPTSMYSSSQVTICLEIQYTQQCCIERLWVFVDDHLND